MIRVLIVFGTRPEAIKMAPVVLGLQACPNHFEVLTCATAQHRELLDQALAPFGITPDVDLNLMRPGQTPSQVASRILATLEPVLQRIQPDWMLVQGDTTTVMASAIAAHHLRIRVGHVEAGLRTGDRWNPFPEEMNRVLTDHISDLCFAPTDRARRNLLAEGIDDTAIRVTGNTVVDALQIIVRQPWSPSPNSPLAQLQGDERIILVTAHRRENFGVPFGRICSALRQIAARFPDTRLVYPVHPNPNVHAIVHQRLGDVPNILLLPPLDYLSLIHVMRQSTLILTDSGGIQEEAPALGVPVLVLRQVTERPEAVESGVARLVGTEPERIIGEASRLLEDPAARDAMARAVNPYGDGHAAQRIADALVAWQHDE